MILLLGYTVPVDPKLDEDCMAGLNLSNTKLKEMEFRQE